MEDLDTDEVAQILNLQPGTVRVRLHRARLSVRKEISRALDDPARSEKPGKARPHGRHRKASQRPAACRELFANLSEYLDERVEPRTCAEMNLGSAVYSSPVPANGVLYIMNRSELYALASSQ